MIFLSIIAAKIIYTDLTKHKILNQDLTLILIISILHHRIYQYKFAAVVLIFGLIFNRFIGAGDTKMLALIVLMKPTWEMTLRSLQFISIGLLILAILYFIRFRKLRVRAPIAPALCVGLLI